MANLPYNLTCFTNSRTFTDIMYCNNGITSNLFGASIIMMVFFISFITMLPFGQKNSLAASLWISTVAGILLWGMNLVAPEITTALIVITALATVFLFRTREN
jgi:hypothetical protein